MNNLISREAEYSEEQMIAYLKGEKNAISHYSSIEQKLMDKAIKKAFDELVDCEKVKEACRDHLLDKAIFKVLKRETKRDSIHIDELTYWEIQVANYINNSYIHMICEEIIEELKKKGVI